MHFWSRKSPQNRLDWTAFGNLSVWTTTVWVSSYSTISSGWTLILHQVAMNCNSWKGNLVPKRCLYAVYSSTSNVFSSPHFRRGVVWHTPIFSKIPWVLEGCISSPPQKTAVIFPRSGGVEAEVPNALKWKMDMAVWNEQSTLMKMVQENWNHMYTVYYKI